MLRAARISYPRLATVCRELSGALADLGVLLPITIALITVNGLSAAGVFFGVGLAYILTGLIYDLPLPVQPLKAVAAIAIARGLSSEAIVAAGWEMGVLLLLLAATDAARWLNSFFTRPVIRGIQLSLGLLLVSSGLSLVARRDIVPGGTQQIVHLASYQISLGWLLAGIALLLLLWGLRRHWPATLMVLGFGALVVLVTGSVPQRLGQVSLAFHLPSAGLPGPAGLASAFVLLVLPQLPLTLGNAVFATADAAQVYFGPASRRVTPRALLTTMGVSQVVAALFGGVPICHGSGGLTAHYRLGARTGLAPLAMGTLCLVLALFSAGSILRILAFVPYPVLGTLLAFVGVQHAWLARDLRGWEWGIALTEAAIAVATSNVALGFAAGIVLQQVGRLTLRLAR